MDANDATRVIAVIDSRIDKKVGSFASTETTWAEVCEVSADGKNCSAYLYGDTDNPSQGFRVPGSLAVSVGDKVKVAWNDRGERWVFDVALASEYKKVALNPSTGEILTGDGTVPPTPLTDLFEATGAVADHEAEADPHPQYAEDGHGHDADYVAAGTSFPASPATNLRFYRTDRGMEYYWDGTRWLSSQVFVWSATATIAASNVAKFYWPSSADYAKLLIDWRIAFRPTSASLSSTNFWYFDLTNDEVTFTSKTFNSGAVNVWQHYDHAGFGSTLQTPAGGMTRLMMQCLPSGAGAGSCELGTEILWRAIG